MLININYKNKNLDNEKIPKKKEYIIKFRVDIRSQGVIKKLINNKYDMDPIEYFVKKYSIALGKMPETFIKNILDKDFKNNNNLTGIKIMYNTHSLAHPVIPLIYFGKTMKDLEIFNKYTNTEIKNNKYLIINQIYVTFIHELAHLFTKGYHNYTLIPQSLNWNKYINNNILDLHKIAPNPVPLEYRIAFHKDNQLFIDEYSKLYSSKGNLNEDYAQSFILVYTYT